ncbi:MAG: hypothetical protein AAGD14_03510 [Planctomycetota bacterium]
MRTLPLLLALLFVGCDHHGHDHHHDHDHDDEHGHDHDGEKHGHAHAPKYGGQLIELGKHEFQVELLAYPETGELEAYLFDGCVERPVPSAMKTLAVELKLGDETVRVELTHDSMPSLVEPEGKSSKFRGQHDKLKRQDHFDGKLVEVTLAGKSFKDVPFHYHVGDHDHDHEH